MDFWFRRLLFVALATTPELAFGASGQLDADHPAHLQLRAGEVRELEISIPAGRYFRVSAAPSAEHVVVVDLLLDGRKVANNASLGGSGGIAAVAAIANDVGRYVLRIRTKSTDTVEHDVRVTMEIRSPGEQEQKDAAAFAALLPAKSVSDFENVRRSAIAAHDAALANQALLLGAWAHLPAGTYAQGAALLEGELASTPSSNFDQRVASEGWYLVGLFNIYQEHHQDAIRAFERGIELQRALGQRSELASSLHNLSCANFLLGQCKRAVPQAEEALAIRRELAEPAREAISLFALAKDRGCLGDSQGALDDYQHLLPLWRTLKDIRNEAATLNDLGVTYASLGDWDRAKSSHNAAIQLREKAGDSAGRVESLVNLGQLANWTGDHKAALEDFTRALEITHDSKRVRGYVLEGLGGTLLSLGNRPDAISRLHEAIEALRESGDRKGEGYAWETLAEAERSTDDANHALALFRDIGDTAGETLTLPKLARIERDHGDLAAARKSLEEALALIESSRVTVSDPSLRMDYLAAKRDAYELYADVLTRGGASEEDSRRAFEASERSHARALLDELAVEPDAPIASIDEIRSSSLDRNTVLIEYLLGADRSWMWTVSSSEFHRFDLPSRAAIEAVAHRLYEALTVRDRRDPSESAAARAARIATADSEVTRASAELRRMILDPARAQIAGRRVLIVADGSLHLIPFGVLGIDSEIARLPSASVLAAMRSRNRPAFGTGPVLVIADPVFSAGDARVAKHAESSAPDASTLPRLTGSRQEAEAIAAAAGRDRVTELLDFDATPAQLSGKAATGAETIHIAAHALVNTRHPDSSGVVLSRVDRTGKAVSGSLSLKQISQLHLRAGLVTLSACDTAVGKEVRGEGPLAISRAFLYAGAQRVLATLWKVDDAATAEFMRRFYQHLYAGRLRPAAALRAAQQEMRAIPRWQSPYYWAAFTLQGDWK